MGVVRFKLKKGWRKKCPFSPYKCFWFGGMGPDPSCYIPDFWEDGGFQDTYCKKCPMMKAYMMNPRNPNEVEEVWGTLEEDGTWA